MKHETSMFLRDLSAMSTSQRNTTHMMFSVVVLFGSIWSICLLYHLAKSCAHLKSCETLQVLQEISCAKVPLQALVLNSRMSALKSPQFPTTKQSQLHGLKTIWSVSGSEYLFLEWTNFLNKVMVLPQFCVESFFWGEGGDSTVFIQINYTSLTVSIFHQIGWSRIWLLHHQIPKKRCGTLFRTFGKNRMWFFASTKSCLQVRSKTLVTPIWRKLAQVRFL